MNMSTFKLQVLLLLGLAAMVPGIITSFVASTRAPFYLGISMRTSHSGNAQLFYDLGRGMNEGDSVRRPMRAGEAAFYRFPLPPAEYRAIRLDPIEHGDGTIITISQMKIFDSSGRTVRRFGPEDFTSYNDVSEKKFVGDILTLKLSPSDIDPNLTITLEPPLVLRASAATAWRAAGQLFCVWFALMSVAGVLWLWLVPKLWSGDMPARWTRLETWSRRRPRRLLLYAAC